MQKFKRLFSILRNEGLKSLFAKIFIRISRIIYKAYARIEDFRIGKVSIDKVKPSKHKDLGAYATESTNYIWLNIIFKSFPLKKDDVFVDVGCGEGRVLTYLYLRKFRNQMIGIELDEQVAQIAAQRTKKCDNIQIYHGNVLEQGELIKDATAVYLFNPFGEKVLTAFVELIEKNVDHPLILYYSNDLHRKVLDKRENWYILRRDIIKNTITPTRQYTIYRYLPNN